MDVTQSPIIWVELMSRNPEASERFYGEVVGLSVATAGEGENAYRTLLKDGQPIGGLTGPPPDSDLWPSGGPEGHWVGYFGSENVEVASKRAEEMGGSVLLGPLAMPGVGVVAVLRDADGATFGLFEPEPRPTEDTPARGFAQD